MKIMAFTVLSQALITAQYSSYNFQDVTEWSHHDFRSTTHIFLHVAELTAKSPELHFSVSLDIIFSILYHKTQHPYLKVVYVLHFIDSRRQWYLSSSDRRLIDSYKARKGWKE